MKYKYIQQYNYCDQKGVITVDFTFDFDRSLTKFDFSPLYFYFKLDLFSTLKNRSFIPIIYLLFVWCLIIHVFYFNFMIWALL